MQKLQLHLPDLLDHLAHREIIIVSPDGIPRTLSPKSPARANLAPIAKALPLAEKFIFDSGSDQDDRTVNAVRDTAVEMMHAGFFHLPHPVTWIEDPFEDRPSMRNYYLCMETEDKITLQVFQRVPKDLDRLGPRYMYNAALGEIDLTKPSDLFTLNGMLAPDLNGTIFQRNFGEAIYALKKFIVSLNTADILKEKVAGKKAPASTPFKKRRFEHTIVTVPYDDGERDDRSFATGGSGEATGIKRRKHLVRGFVWGRNTRPVEEQRWVRPHWRGSQEVGVVEHGHHVVKAKVGV